MSHTWLQDGILTRNWPLVQELLELMLLCPVDVQRLKSNSAPKLVKGLSKEGGNEGKFGIFVCGKKLSANEIFGFFFVPRRTDISIEIGGAMVEDRKR